ncbi:hypothetical protein [Streptomyces canus]|uniref:hypothetical protein n=1 Tax=Streptomyces canus TaxID=58343 RepID=UPI002E2A993D|nr:hypothetical protein [Streptomyces canus]
MATRKPFDRDPDRRISLGLQRNRHDLERRLRPSTTEGLAAAKLEIGVKRIAQTIRLRPERREGYLRHHDVLFAYIEYDGDDFEIWHLGDPDTESPS